MTKDEWEVSFFATLLALMGLAGSGTMMVTSGGNAFGEYVVQVVPKEGDTCIVYAMEKQATTASTDAMKWPVDIKTSDPHNVAREVATWLGPRMTQS